MSQTPRIYQNQALQIDQLLTLSSPAHQHLSTVLKCRTGESVYLFNGEKGDFLATIVQQTKKITQVQINDYHPVDHESSIAIELGQVVARGDKMDWVIQKAVELGVTAITPLTSARCGVKLPDKRWHKKHQHWQNVIVSACEQSRRVKLPRLNPVNELTSWLKQTQSPYKWILHPHTHNQAYPKQVVNDIALLVGPEGGFNDNEVALAQQHGFHLHQLGSRVLRTETAALAAISQLQTLYGDFN